MPTAPFASVVTVPEFVAYDLYTFVLAVVCTCMLTPSCTPLLEETLKYTEPLL